MNGYVLAGYLISIGSLSFYGATLVARERSARRRAPRATVLDSVGATASPDEGSGEP